MKVFLTSITLLALALSQTSSAVSLSSLPIKKTKNIPERQLGGNVEAQMDAEDASKIINFISSLK